MLTLSFGNTPTCVGKTKTGSPKQALLVKHPHVRGEDALERCASILDMETPPRAWGRLRITAFYRG